jgi:hypothetical protein
MMLADPEPDHQELEPNLKATDPVDIEESEGSSDEYEPPAAAHKDDGETEVEETDLDSEVDAEVEDEEKPKKGKLKKPKPARADIIAKRNVTSASTGRTEAKRKANHDGYDSLFTWYNSFLPEKNLNSDGLNSNGLSKKKMKHASHGSKDSPQALLSNWNNSASSGLASAASRTQDTVEEDESMVQSGGFVGDDETDDLERKSLLVFKGGKKKVVVSHF